MVINNQAYNNSPQQRVKDSMQRVVIFGNSGSGKSTLAKSYAAEHRLSHLDLDKLAWLDTNPPTRKPVNDSAILINQFLENSKKWVIEGCYSDLLRLVINKSTHVVFLNPSIKTCINNCISRPWEPHKYKTEKEQDDNLEMLISWVKDYSTRNDEFSLNSHRKLFDKFQGEKIEYNSNERNL